MWENKILSELFIHIYFLNLMVNFDFTKFLAILQNAHKITEQEYESLFEENNTFDQAPAMASTVSFKFLKTCNLHWLVNPIMHIYFYWTIFLLFLAHHG